MAELVVFVGMLSAYALGPTVGTVNLRQEWGQLPGHVDHYDVLLAVDDCSLIGHEGMMLVGEQAYSALVFDCAGRDAARFMVDGNADTPHMIAAEADYFFWMDNPDLVGSGRQVRVEISRNG